MKLDNKVKLYISTFGFDCNWIKSGIPIEVGAAIRDNFIYPLKDDTGDNISRDNPYWGELTGLYWIWKNIDFKDDDIIGFAHYNKILRVNKKVLKVCRGGVILKPISIVSHAYPQDIFVLCDVMKKKYPKYYEVWRKLYNEDGSSISSSCSNCELFYLIKPVFDGYCAFLFGVLSEVRAIIGDVERSPYHKRYCAFLGERLLSVYLLANNVSVDYAEMVAYRKFPLSILSRLVHFLKINKNPLYLKLRNKMNKNKIRKSSYSRN